MTAMTASEMGKLRWSGKSAEERSEHARMMNRLRWAEWKRLGIEGAKRPKPESDK